VSRTVFSPGVSRTVFSPGVGRTGFSTRPITWVASAEDSGFSAM
jgi:hypothetical protein